MAIALELLDAIGNLYAASTDPSLWEVALRQLSELFACNAAVLFLVDSTAVTTRQSICFEFPEETMQEYGTEMLKICPRYRAHLEHPERKVLFDYQHTPESKIDRHLFYRWLDESAGMRYYLGTMLDVDQQSEVALMLHHTKREGHFQRSDIELFAKLIPHFERVVRFRARLGYLDARMQAMQTALDRLSCGVVLVDRAGVVALVNAAGERLLRARDGLFLNKGLLKATHRADNQVLQAEILQVTATPLQDGIEAGGAIAVRRPSGKRAYSVMISPTPIPMCFVANRPAALIIIADPENAEEPPLELIRARFGLTPAEANVTIQLCSGLRLEDIAELLHVSVGTVRSHLKRIFSKTGVRRQAELVSLVVGGSGSVNWAQGHTNPL